jgi:probable DNA metabolism protein
MDPGDTPWEDLWRTYHRAINNPCRKNPGLQRQFMPLRYWKYLSEMEGG